MVDFQGVKFVFGVTPKYFGQLRERVRVSYLLFALSSLFLWSLLYGIECANTPAPEGSAPIKNLCSKFLGILKDTQKVSK